MEPFTFAGSTYKQPSRTHSHLEGSQYQGAHMVPQPSGQVVPNRRDNIPVQPPPTPPNATGRPPMAALVPPQGLVPLHPAAHGHETLPPIAELRIGMGPHGTPASASPGFSRRPEAHGPDARRDSLTSVFMGSMSSATPKGTPRRTFRNQGTRSKRTKTRDQGEHQNGGR